MLETLGLGAGLALLIVLALRGVNIVFASLLSSLLVAVTNQLPVAQSFAEYYAFGPLGAFQFAGRFFLLFICGAMFGRMMGESGAAASIALALTRSLGAHRILWVITIACAVLTYSGVVVFIVIFTLYPLGLRLLQEANIPKRLFVGALALGGGTFTLTAVPGTPSIQNVISSAALGTNLFSGAILGVVGAVLMFAGGMWYLERQRLQAAHNGEIFVAHSTDVTSNQDTDLEDHPDWRLAIIPLLIVLSIIIAPRLVGVGSDAAALQDSSSLHRLIAFSLAQPILWPSIALFVGSIAAAIMFPQLRTNSLYAMGRGTEDAIVPLFNTAAVIGFGGVVVHTAGFQQFTGIMLETGMPPLISMFGATSLTSALVGSSSGGLQIFMETLAPSYLEMGIDAPTLHRLATMASGGFDSLPHCGAVVAILTITKLTHKEAYKDIFVITVVMPVVATLAAMAVAAVFF